MDPTPQTTDESRSAEARVESAGPPSPEIGNTAPLETGQPARAHKRRNLIYVLGLVLLAVGLVGLAIWWALSRQVTEETGPVASSGVREDAVALINSATPITPTLPRATTRDSAVNLNYEPERERWSQALREAHRAQEEGRFPSAISQYSALVTSSSPQEARDALWGLASAYESAGQDDLAIRAYSLFEELDDPRAVRALARIGQIHADNGRSSEAIRAYGEYAKRAGPARHAVQLMQTRLMGNVAGAEELYKAVLDGNPQDVDLRQALAGLAELKSRQGDRAEARRLYDRLASIQEDRPRPALDNNSMPPQVLAADELTQAGDKEGARKVLLDYVKSGCKGASCSETAYPYGLYLALNSLLKLDPTAVVSGSVAPMMAANISYNAGFYGKAIDHLDIVRATSPNSPDLPLAALMTGKAFEASGDPAAAYNWYTATLQTYPDAPQAAEAIRRAGDALESQAAWDMSLAVYREAVARYPNGGDETLLARLHGAVLGYRLDQRDVALELIRPVLAGREVSPTILSEATFWASKLEKGAGNPAWKSGMEKVPALASGSYFGFRARSLLDGEPDDGPLSPTFQESGVAASDLGARYPQEGREGEALLTWASGLARSSAPATATATITASVTITQPSILSSQHSEMQRAAALLNLGFEDEAYRSFRALAESLRSERDGRSLAELAIYLRYHADPRTAMVVAEELTALDAAGDPLKRPALLLKMLYPTPYGAPVLDESALRNIDPLMVYALMRQESQFVPDAVSSADARGLMQIIPSTGQGIAEQLGDTRYSIGDLNLPYMNIRYGVYYLANNLPQFDRKLFPTLAAYNGGPGNAARWQAGSALIDPDLYIERVDFFETRDYLRRVYTNYGFYREIYGK